MKIATRTKVITLFSIIVLAAFGASLVFSFYQDKKSMAEDSACDQITARVMDINLLTNDYFFNRSQRAMEQWWSVYNEIGRLCSAAVFSTREQNDTMNQIIKKHTHISDIFSSLLIQFDKVSKDEAAEELKKRLSSQLLMESQSLLTLSLKLHNMTLWHGRALQQTIMLLRISLFIALFMVLSVNSFWLLRRLVVTINKLHKGAEIIGSGNLDYKVGTDAKDEIGQLSRAFDRMTEALKRQTASVEASEKRIRNLMENLPIGIAISTSEGRVLEVNSTIWKTFGFDSKEEFVKVPDSAHYYNPEDRQRVIELRGRGETSGFEARFKRKDGTAFWCSVNSVSIITDEGTMDLNIFQDITERKQAEESLRASEVRFRSLVTASAQVVWTTNAQGEVSEDLPTWRAYTGQSREEIKGWGWSNALHPKDRERTAAIWSHAVETRSLYYVEYRIRQYDGEYRLFAARGVPVLEEDGSIREWVGTCTDITEQKRAEEKIKKLNEELEQRVLERTAQLEVANKELESFSYSVSHDLRAPLRHITGFVELLNRRMPKALDDKSRHYLEVISSSARHMGKLVDDLLSFARMGRADMMKTRTNLDDLLKEAMNELRGDMEGRDIRWKVGPLPEVSGDSAMLRLAFANLLSNAVKFTRPRKQAEIEIGQTSSDDREYIFYVKDNGVGFDQKYVDKLFGLFQRLHRAEEFEGTGLGLANVRRIIHRHGGKTWAEGAVDGGAAFYFSLPKEKEEQTDEH